jgi:hypothetical protein
MNNGEMAMLIKTSIALAAAAFLGFASAASAGDTDTKFRQAEGFSFHVGPLGQYFGSTPPRPGYYYGYGYSPYGYVHRYHRRYYYR